MLTQNSKLRKTSKKHGLRVFNFGIPAYQSKDGFSTCPKAGACIIGCYAKSGAYLFSNVAQAFERRLGITKQDNFPELMIAEIKKKKADIVRIHDSGDFYSVRYLYKWAQVIEALPNVKFYAYTKQVSMFEGITDIPKNFTVIYSFGGTEDNLINVGSHRHARVFETIEELKAAGYANGSDDDLIAVGPNKRIGLVYHGAKSYKNTNWKYNAKV